MSASRSSAKARRPARSAAAAPAVAAKAQQRAAAAAVKKPAARPRARRSREPAADRRARAGRILATLRILYPDADCALRHRSAFELLVATILSAQCTDERVNKVTPDLFRRYPDVDAMADAKREDLEAAIRSTGFFRNKAKSLIGMSRRARDEFGGEIPDKMDDLLSLPGVARKTANCVLGTWFRKNEGVVVDTHVGRLALRLRLLTSARDDKDAVRIERELMGLFERDAWTFLSHALIDHGRQICLARKPDCARCELAPHCPSAGTFDSKKK
jgi:endonuclease-3